MEICLYCENETVLSFESTTEHDLQTKILSCAECNRFMHISCLKSSSPSTIPNDYLYDVTCAKCTGIEDENYKRPKKLGWLYIVILLLYNLQANESGRQGFFHWKDHIYALLLKHSSELFHSIKKRNQTMAGTVAGLLSAYNGSVFTSGNRELGEPGWWKLITCEPPLLTNVYRKPESDSTFGASYPSTSTSSTQRRDSSSRLRKRKSIPDDFVTGNLRSSKIIVKSEMWAENIFPIDYSDIDCDIDVNVGDRELPTPTGDCLPELADLCDCIPDLSDDAANMEILQPDTSTECVNSRSEKLTPSHNISHEDEADDGSQESNRTLSDDEHFATCQDIEDKITPHNVHETVSQLNSETAGKEKIVKMTSYEEADFLSKLNELVEDGVKLSHEGAMLRRKLHIRKVKRQAGLKLLEFPGPSQEVEVKMNKAVTAGSGISAPLFNKADRFSILDRFQTSVKMESVDRYIPFIKRLHGSTESGLQSIRSAYTSRVLRPYVWRDFETKPPKLKLLEAVRSRVNSENSEVLSSIDYSYVRAEHIPVINRMCHQSFWPGIDLSESLQYPDFSCVAMYKKLIIGFAFMVPDVNHNDAYVSFIFTHQEWRGAGIATFMLYHLIQTCMGKDVTLHVSVTNPALSLYLKFGFVIEELILNFYDKYLSADSKDCKHAFFLRLARY